MRTLGIWIVCYSLVLQSCRIPIQSSSSSSEQPAKKVRPAGPLKNFSEITSHLALLSEKTKRWLECRHHEAEDQPCAKLRFTDQNLSDQEFKRLWLKNLLVAKQQALYEPLGVRLGIDTQKIETDIKSLQEELKDDIHELNQEFFKEVIGKDPFDQQKKYFSSWQFARYLNKLSSHQRRNEVEKQLIILKQLNPDFFKDKESVRQMIASHVTVSGIMRLTTKKRSEGFDEPLVVNYFSDIILLFEERTDAILAELLEAYDPSQRQALAEKYVGQMSDEERKVVNLYLQMRAAGPDALATVLVEAFQAIASSEEDLLNFESRVESLIIASIEANQEKWIATPSFVAGNIKFAISAFFAFDSFGILRTIYTIIGTTLLFNSTRSFDPSPGFILGVGSGLAWTMNSAHALFRMFGGPKRLTALVTKVWPKVTAVVPQTVMDLHGGFLKFYLNLADHVLSPFLKKVAGILYRSVTFLNIATLITLIYSIYDLSQSWASLSTVQKALHIMGLGIFVSWLAVGVMSVFITVPHGTLFWVVSTVVAFFVYLFISIFRKLPKDVRPKEDDPKLDFYQNQIHPQKNYWFWCKDEENGGQNCAQSFQPGVFADRSELYDDLVIAPAIGGPGGSKMLINHDEIDNEGTGLATHAVIRYYSIKEMSLWRCPKKGKEDIGLSYEIEIRNPRCEDARLNCVPRRSVDMGCAKKNHEPSSLKTLTLLEGEFFNRAQVFHTIYQVKSRRVVRLKLCTNRNRCVEHDQIAGVGNERSTEYQSDVQLTHEGRVRSGEGEITGLYGAFGDTIDRVGFYYRVKARPVYRAEIFDESLPWSHVVLPDDRCIQALNQADLDPDISRWRIGYPDLSSQKGLCPCRSFQHVSEESRGHIKAYCNQIQKLFSD